MGPLGRAMVSTALAATLSAATAAGLAQEAGAWSASTAVNPAGAGPEVVPAPPPALERLPEIANDPPVPYFSAFQGAPGVEPAGPMLELPGYKTGWMASAEVSLVSPFVHNGLNSGRGTVGAIPENVQVPQAGPGGAVYPRLGVDLGYRFAEGLGEVHMTYHNLNTDITHSIDNFDAAGAGQVTSRLSLNVLDLDYCFPELNYARIARASPLLMIPGRLGLGLHSENVPPAPLGIKYFAGVRVANAFFDSQGSGGQILGERLSNNFVGGGPRFGVELSKGLGGTPWSLYGRFEVSGLLGKANQTFSRSEISGGTTISGAADVNNLSLGVPVLDAAFGLRYVPQWGGRPWRLTWGYVYEQWFYLGETSTSNAGITLNGVVFRGELGF